MCRFHSKIFSHNNEKKILFFGCRGTLDEKYFQFFFSLPILKQVLIRSDSSLKSPIKYLETKIRNAEIGVPWIGILIVQYLCS